MNIEIKSLIKKICASDGGLVVDHDLNVSILESESEKELNALIKNMSFNELYRVTGYFIDELEGDGINMDDNEMDDPNTYLSYCLDECELTLEDAQSYVNEFKLNNVKS